MCPRYERERFFLKERGGVNKREREREREEERYGQIKNKKRGIRGI